MNEKESIELSLLLIKKLEKDIERNELMQQQTEAIFELKQLNGKLANICFEATDIQSEIIAYINKMMPINKEGLK